MDYFIKWPEAYALPNQESTAMAELLVHHLFYRFGVTQELHWDQGRNIELSIFRKMCRFMDITKIRATPLHHRLDGMVERFNKTIKENLRI